MKKQAWADGLCRGVEALGGRMREPLPLNGNSHPMSAVVLPDGRVIFALLLTEDARGDANCHARLKYLRRSGAEAYALHSKNDAAIFLQLCREYVENAGADANRPWGQR